MNKSSLSFTTSNWGTAQEVTVTGVNDEIANSAGRREVTIAHSASGGDYGSVTGSVGVTVIDDDSVSTTPKSITLSVSPNEWSEGSGNTTVTVTATPVGGTFDADQTVTVSVADSDVTQAVGFTAVASFAVTISADSTSGSGTFSLSPVNNSVVNVDETITISGTVSPSTVLVNSASLTLADDDDPTGAPTDPPGNAMATSGDGSLDLSWLPVAGATSYEFQYRIKGGAIPDPWPWTDAGSSTSYTIPDLENRMTYIVRVRGRNSFGPGPLVKLFGTPRPQDLLPAPANLVASSGNSWLRVSWSPVDGASSYQVQYRVQGETIPDPWPWTATDSASKHTLTGLTNRSTYIVRVRAVNAMGVGGNVSRVFGTPRVPPSPEVSIEAAGSQVDEGASVGFMVSATPAPAESLTVNLTVSGGEAFLTGTIPTTATIVPGQTSAPVTLLTEDDVVDEPNGTVTVSVVSGDGYGLAAVTSAQISINDDDDPPTGIALSVSPQSVSEADSTAIVTVTASPAGGTRYATEQTVTVSVAGGGGANAVDFEPVGDFVVTISAGAEKGSGTFELSPVDNTTSNADETITISGTGPSGVSITSATMTLADDDVPVVTIMAVADSVAEGTSATFTVSASPAPYASLTVNILVSGGTDFLSDSTPDSVVVIGAGGTSAVLSLGTDDDETDERDASMTVSVQSGSGYVVGENGSARVVIQDDDLPEGAPAVPGNVQVMGGDRQVTLSWSAAARATWYEVQYREMGAPIPDPWLWTDVGDVTSYTFDGLENGTTYKLRLRAVNESDSSRVVKIDGRPSGMSARKLARTAAGVVPAVVNTPDDFTLEAGDSRTLDVTATFTGDELTYSASSTDASVASATMTDGIMTVRGLTSGTAILSVTARNGAGSAGYTLSVTVTPGVAERAAYENVLAAMGRGLLSSARATMEDRFSAIGVQHSLALAGRRVDGMETGVSALIGLAGYHIPRHWNDQISPMSAASVDVLRSSSFIYTLPGYGSVQGTGGVTVWGTGNVQAFRSSPSGLRYNGRLRTGFMGVDISTPGLVAGLSVSRTQGLAGFNTLGIQGEMSTRMTGVYPYARWRSTARPLEIWSILGAGRGEAVARDESRNLSMRMAMMGLRVHWMDMAGLGLSVVGHAGLLSLTAPSQPGHVLGDLNAGIRQVRLGMEGSAAGISLGSSRLTPFAQVAGRYDGGTGESGSGLEVAGGLRLAAGRLGVEARGRILAAHTASSYRERGLSLIAYLRPVTGRGGLSVSLAPRWGHDTRAVDMTWRDDAVVVTGGGYAEKAGAVRAQVGYSMRYPTLRGLVVTPFGEADLSASARRLMRLGTRMGSQEGMMSLELVGERRQDRTGDDHRVGLLARMRF
ncbi:MAG: fibronectin type III domain-containing protein [Boseongicola sp. SB0664_bin_43]|uniref:Fibronectin type III domain-containing protein n=1 Tax=Boseongicola sp. SB0664_bin_43 TaxID=2604844 RepID=A0A6B0Y1N8_9RHOB|nr:fibronectin type III domain-containing protein [Boseongicola sp. SB0664_bin_43]